MDTDKLKEVISDLNPKMHIHESSKFQGDIRRADTVHLKLWEYGGYSSRQGGPITREGEQYILDVDPKDEDGYDLSATSHTFSCGDDRGLHVYQPKGRNKRVKLLVETDMDSETFRDLYFNRG